MSSLANPRLKAALRLRGRRERDRPVDADLRRARDRPRPGRWRQAERSFRFDPVLRGRRMPGQVPGAARRGIPMWGLGPDAFAKLAYGDRLDGIISAADTAPPAAHLQLPANPLIGVIEGVEKPGNLSASCARPTERASAVIVAEPGTDLLNPDATAPAWARSLPCRWRSLQRPGPDLATGAADHDRGGAHPGRWTTRSRLPRADRDRPGQRSARVVRCRARACHGAWSISPCSASPTCSTSQRRRRSSSMRRAGSGAEAAIRG